MSTQKLLSLHTIEQNLILWRILDVCCHTNDTWHIPNYFGRSCCSFQFPNFDVLYHYLLYVHIFIYEEHLLASSFIFSWYGCCRYQYYKWWYFQKLNGFQIVWGNNNDEGIFRVYSAFPLNSFLARNEFLRSENNLMTMVGPIVHYSTKRN